MIAGIMKRILATIITVILIVSYNGMMAQQGKAVNEKVSIISFNAGISIPIICYGRNDLAKNNFAGFARPGFTLEINYGWLFTKNVGIAAKAFYSSNRTDLRV